MAGNWNSGRRPLPTRLQVLRGRKKPRAEEPEPEPVDPSFDDPPPELEGNELARAEWSRIAPMLRMCGLISNADRASLIALCQQWAIYIEAEKKIRSLGMIVKKPSGVPCVNPYFSIAEHSLKLCRQLWAELGLTPSGRSRVSALLTAEPEKVQSRWAGLLS